MLKRTRNTSWHGRDGPPDGDAAAGAGDERAAWLVAPDLRLQALPLVLTDVGQVRYDEVDVEAGIRTQSDIQAEPLRVRARDLERRRRDVGCRHLEVGALVLERERDCARP